MVFIKKTDNKYIHQYVTTFLFYNIFNKKVLINFTNVNINQQMIKIFNPSRSQILFFSIK